MIRSFVLALALFGTTPVWAAVEIQEVTSPGGIQVWLVEEHSIPFTSLEIRVRGGGLVDEPGKRGSVNLMMALLEEGSGDMDAREFAEAEEALAASFSYDAYDDAVSVSAKFLTENRDEAVALLRQALIDPHFDQVALDRVRGQVLSIIRSDANDPGSIAGDNFNEIAFGDHPYASSLNGTLESVESLTQEDMFNAHKAALNRANLYVGAAGDITAEELGVLLDDLLGDLPQGELLETPDVPVTLTGDAVVIDYPTPQSTAIFGQPGISRDDPDFFAAFIANQIFGGSGLQSRLSQEVREERGLTYGIGTFLTERDGAPLLLGQVATENARMGETVDVVRQEWARVAEQGFTAEELDQAKTYLTGAYPLRFDGNGPISNIMVGMQMTGLTPDYIATRNDKVMAVTLEDVNRVAGELYQLELLEFVIVGQPEGIEDAESN